MRSLLFWSSLVLLLLFVVVPVASLITMSAFAQRPDNLGSSGGQLAPCPDSPNCVSTQAEDPKQRMEPIPYNSTGLAAMQALKTILQAAPGGRIVKARDNYVHAEFSSRVFRFIDDVEFLVDDEKKQIQFRSASRVGYSDFGANRKRMENLREAIVRSLTAIGIAGTETSVMTDDNQESAIMAGEEKFALREPLPENDKQWRSILTPEQYNVTRRHGTERAFTGEYWNSKKAGTYTCVCCGLPLFSSQTKFESGTGWPSFWQPLNPDHIGTEVDTRLFTRRTEVHCNRCGAHLGHVFNDGPRPTGLRYCINSVSLDLVEKKPAEKKEESE